MEFNPHAPPRLRRFRLGIRGALFISVGLHVALLAIFYLATPAGVLVITAGEETTLPGSRLSTTPAPLHFTFVDVPDDEPVAENPHARLFSDKNRVARQPTPTPPGATDLGSDPHSEGNSQLRQLARGAPPSPVPPAAPGPPPSSRSGGVPEAEGKEGEGADRRDGEGFGMPVEGGRKGTGGDETIDGREARQEAFQQALEQLRTGSYDFSTFDNPSYLKGGNYGTLSFDTKDYEWGDYARQIYLIVKKNWYDRIPIAAWYGQKGKVFLRFVIEKDGSISDLQMTLSSSVPPLDRAAENAIRASDPLPPLPPDFPGEREGVRYGFYYNLPID